MGHCSITADYQHSDTFFNTKLQFLIFFKSPTCLLLPIVCWRKRDSSIDSIFRGWVLWRCWMCSSEYTHSVTNISTHSHSHRPSNAVVLMLYPSICTRWCCIHRHEGMRLCMSMAGPCLSGTCLDWVVVWMWSVEKMINAIHWNKDFWLTEPQELYIFKIMVKYSIHIWTVYWSKIWNNYGNYIMYFCSWWIYFNKSFVKIFLDIYFNTHCNIP